MSPAAIVVDAELRLEPRHPDEANEMWQVIDANRDDLRTWLPWVDATLCVADVERSARSAYEKFERKRSCVYAIRVHDRIVGSIGTHETDWHARETSIGYWLAPQMRGRGIVTRAAAALVDTLIEEHALERITIECVVENVSSRAVAERLGFMHEATFTEPSPRREGLRHIARYATTAAAWRNRTISVPKQ